MAEKTGMTYADAGVDIDKADGLVEDIKAMVASTKQPGVIGGIGGFGGIFALPEAGYSPSSPKLISSTDGVGTKLKIAFLMDKHDTVGIDLVAMCATDVAVQGAKPLFFLDYFATGKLKTNVAELVIKGIVDGCLDAGCALIGGETAEMPGMYGDNEYDLAGFCVGATTLAQEEMLNFNHEKMVAGYKLIGVASNGLHSNGYSLVRKIVFEKLKLSVHDHIDDLGCTIGEELLRPTTIYAGACQSLILNADVAGLAHITGGGMTNNVPRVLPGNLGAIIELGSWPVDRIFRFLENEGPVLLPEMIKTFNYGIGLVAIVPPGLVDSALHCLGEAGYVAYEIGETMAMEKMPNGQRVAYV